MRLEASEMHRWGRRVTIWPAVGDWGSLNDAKFMKFAWDFVNASKSEL